MAGTIRNLMTDAVAASFNPSDTYRASLRTLAVVMKGELDDISPMNPVVLAIETQAALIAAFVEENHASTRRLLQSASQNKEDLYPHMADIHFTNIFNLPSRTTFSLVLNKNEIIAAMVPIPGSQSKKLTIPRNTYFRIGEYEFGIHYPIDIIQQLHGGLHVQYDTSRLTVLQKIKSNMLAKRYAVREDIEYLIIDIPVMQFSVTTKTPTVVSGSTFSFSAQITDKYYATRVYRTLANGTQEEIRVIYSEEIYDPYSPTAVVRVLDGEIKVMVPQIYITNGQILGELRIDVYTTKGPLQTSFDSYPMGAIVPTFRDLFKRAEKTYTAPMGRLGTTAVLGEKPVSGGALAMSFSELRQAVIADAIGDPNLPITPAQIQNYLSRKGYDIIKNTDIVTDRVFLATREMPQSENETLLTAANASIETMNSSFSELVANSGVIDNDTSVTIKSNVIYRLSDGILKMVTDSELETIRQMRSEILANHVTNGNYLYSPYHYVLDKTSNQFRLGAYYLDEPRVDSQSFYRTNESTQLSVSTSGYSLTKTDFGYTLRVTTVSSDEYKAIEDEDVTAILRYQSPTETDPAWLVGQMVGLTSSMERIFEFKLDSRFFMNDKDRIGWRNFKMYNQSDIVTFSDLEQEFNLTYCTTATMGSLYKASEMDAKLPRFLLPVTAVGITEEILVLNFGVALTNLWSRARSVASSVVYETYDTDVIQRYKEDVYKKDPATNSDIFWNNGLPSKIKLHSKGDPILTPEGEEIIQYPKGTIRIDPLTGEPMMKSGRYLKHRFEMFLVEGVYIFSNDQIAIDYRKALAKTVADWVKSDLSSIEEVTMDKSRAYFYPKTIFGTIEVMTGDGLVQQVNAAQRFDVSLFVPLEVKQNPDLLSRLKKQTVYGIAKGMKPSMLAISDISELLKADYGSDVIDAQISWFGEQANIPVMQLVNEVHRCGIRKRLVSRDDGKLVVEEDITVTFQTLQ